MGRPYVHLGNYRDLCGLVYLLAVDPGHSTFGAPAPEALEQCVEGIRRYAKKLEPPFTLGELADSVPPDMRPSVLNSRCVKYAFYTSLIDPRQFAPGIYVTNDPVVYHNLTRYLEPLGASDCACPVEAVEFRPRVMDPLEFFDFYYREGLRKMFGQFAWRLPQILFKRRWRTL
ncbi:MAG: hypothetical protein QXI07_11905 [Pyrobaculum sp.]